MRHLLGTLFFTAVLMSISCGRKETAGISVDPAFKPLIPPDTKALAGVDLEKLKTTPIYKRHENDFNLALLNSSSERIGVDVRRDVTSLLIAWNGKQPVVMAHGHFEPKTVEQKIAGLGASRKSYKGYTLLGDDQNSLVLLKNAVAVAGASRALHTVLDLENNGEGAVPEELEERLRTLPKGDQIWVVSRGGLPFAEMPMRSDYESALSNIVGYVRGASIAIGLDTGARLEANFTCISDQGAQRVRDAIRAGIAMGRLTTRDNERELLQMYDAFHIDQDKQMVHVTADLPGELADKLLAYLPRAK